jgi:hypothetical protein
VYLLSANTPNFKLELPRIQGTKDQTAGWIFLAALCLSLIVLAITYVALHNRFRQATPTEVQVFLSQIDQAVQQTQDAEKTSASEELATSMTAIRDTWQVISNTVGISQNKTMIASLVGNVEAAIPQDDQSKTLANLQTIRQIITEGIFRIFFWTQEPWRYLEVLLWGLAGILVYLIVRIGYYLRSGRFYREGIYMHISHAFGIPVLALVFVLLLSQVSLTLTITNTQVNLDLTDPRLLAAFSFIIGSQPWYLFDTIRQTAGKVTGREEEPAKPSK